MTNLDFATTGSKTPDFKTVRDTATAHSWTMRLFCPSYTIYASPDGAVELTVWFFQSSGNLEGATLSRVGDGTEYQVMGQVKRGGLRTLLGWLGQH